MKSEISLVLDALVELARESRRMLEDTTPQTPLPRPRAYRIARGWAWPNPQGAGRDMFLSIQAPHGQVHLLRDSLEKAAEMIVKGMTAEETRKTVSKIRAAAEWCRRRAEDRRRRAAEILRQQQEDMEWLEAIAAIHVLSGLDNPL